MRALFPLGLTLAAASFAPTDAYAQSGGKSLGIISAVADPGHTEDVRLYLACSQVFFEIQLYDGAVGTPTIDDVSRHDALLIFNEVGNPFFDPDQLGDLAHAFLVQGGGVVVAGGALDVTNGTAIEGQISSGEFMPLDLSGGGGIVAEPGLGWRRLAVPLPNVDGGLSSAEWITYGMNSFDGGQAFHIDGLERNTGAVTVAQWVRDAFQREPLATYKEPPASLLAGIPEGEPLPGRVVALNFYPPSDRAGPGLWDIETDADELVSHALRFAMRDDAPPIECDDGNPGRYNTFVGQDLNCNTIDVNDELLVDLDDPECQTNVDDDGNPYESQDYYYDYGTFGCRFFMLPYDEDDMDLLGGGTLTIERPDGNPLPWAQVQLCDNCPEDFNPDQLDFDCDGSGDLCDVCVFASGMQGQANDDQDCWGNDCDNCPDIPNDLQEDRDLDGVGDVCDNCPDVPNDQNDDDGEFTADGIGDVCDNCPGFGAYYWAANDQLLTHPNPDPWIPMVNPGQENSDTDPWGDACDNCPFHFNPGQEDADADNLGDACDLCPNQPVPENGDPALDLTDSDGDGIGDACDACPFNFNPDQGDIDLDGVGDACDNCPFSGNPEQADIDEDGIGDVCDLCPDVFDPSNVDSDGDGIGDACDNCPDVPNPDQNDRDLDGFGDRCDLCFDRASDNNFDSDNDGIGDACDNCPFTFNPDQADGNRNGLGDVCDIYAIRGGGAGASAEGGCNSAPSGSSGLLVGLLAALGFRRRSRRSQEVI